VLLQQRLNGSASSSLLKRDFTVDNVLPGWDLAFLKGVVLWERNMIHFAPTHPEQLWSYEVPTGRSERLFPQPQDPFREDFKHRLAAIVDRNKCRINNWSCNPDQFGSDIADIEVNQETSAFAVRVGFSTEGFLASEEADESRCRSSKYRAGLFLLESATFSAQERESNSEVTMLHGNRKRTNEVFAEHRSFREAQPLETEQKRR